jgi:hypothetical protein
VPIGKLYRTWKEQIRALRPSQRITQIENFAWMMVGIYESGSVHLSKIAGKVIGNAKLLSTVRRIERFLDNKAIEGMSRLQGDGSKHNGNNLEKFA